MPPPQTSAEQNGQEPSTVIEMPFHHAHLRSGARIGPRDAGAGAGQPWSEEWRQSCIASIDERICTNQP